MHGIRSERHRTASARRDLVVALEQAVAGPFATRQLADLGARVIKVERPGGDFARHYDDSVRSVQLHRGPGETGTGPAVGFRPPSLRSRHSSHVGLCGLGGIGSVAAMVWNNAGLSTATATLTRWAEP
jgi:hypothetical protein